MFSFEFQFQNQQELFERKRQQKSNARSSIPKRIDRMKGRGSQDLFSLQVIMSAHRNAQKRGKIIIRDFIYVIESLWRCWGYYMVAQTYNTYLRVLKNISWVSAANVWKIFEHSKINVVSLSGHVIFCLLYTHQWNTNITISWTNALFPESI